MSNQETLRQAIGECRLVQFYYEGGVRIVEPHMSLQSRQAYRSQWLVRIRI